MSHVDPTDRQRELVRLLTSGSRCSLNRALRLAGYGKHNAGLAQMLASPALVALFADAVERGDPLPMAHGSRIMAAITERDVAALQ